MNTHTDRQTDRRTDHKCLLEFLAQVYIYMYFNDRKLLKYVQEEYHFILCVYFYDTKYMQNQ